MKGRVLRLASELAEAESKPADVFLFKIVLVLEKDDAAVRDCKVARSVHP